MPKKRIGDLLIERGLITEKELDFALQMQKQTRDKLGEVLVKNNIVSEEDMAGLSDDTLAEYCHNAINAMSAAVADYKSGKEKALMALLGNVMKQSRGRADANAVKEKLKELIG